MGWSRRSIRGLLAATLVLITAGCGADPNVRAEDGEVTDGYRARDEQQSQECDGSAAVPADQLRLLDPGASVVAVTLCTTPTRYRPGQGLWQTRVTANVPADRIPAVVAALTVPDGRPHEVCDAMLMILPSFSVTLSDGSKLRPGVPGDGCHASAAATELMSSPGAPQTVEYLQLVVPQQALVTGCGTGASQPAIWFEAAQFESPPKSGPLSLCRYRTEADPQDKGGPLVAVGSAPASTVGALWKSAKTTPATGCRPSGDELRAPPEGWLMIIVPPENPLPAADQDFAGLAGDKIVALVELGGCHRLVGPGRSALRYADPAVTAALGRLTSPVQVPPPPTR